MSKILHTIIDKKPLAERNIIMSTDALRKRFMDLNFSIEPNLFCGIEFDIVAKKKISRATDFYVAIKFIGLLDGTAAAKWKKDFDHLVSKNNGTWHNSGVLLGLVAERATPAAAETLATYFKKTGVAMPCRIYVASRDLSALIGDIPTHVNKAVSELFTDAHTILSDALYLEEL